MALDGREDGDGDDDDEVDVAPLAQVEVGDDCAAAGDAADADTDDSWRRIILVLSGR
jgi:hypothetical protein